MSERIAIIDVGSGNLRSVEKAFERAVREAGRADRLGVTSDPAIVAEADRVILPGVGAFRACMDGLLAVPGLVSALEQAVLVRGRPFLGVCVGMQMLADRGMEFGETAGLGWMPGAVRRLEARPGRRVPHMGWNTVRWTARHPAIPEALERQDVYFVHSYHFEVENAAHSIGVCDYDGEIVAAVARDNLLAVQFHPEKSQAAGLALLSGFLGWRP